VNGPQSKEGCSDAHGRRAVRRDATIDWLRFTINRLLLIWTRARNACTDRTQGNRRIGRPFATPRRDGAKSAVLRGDKIAMALTKSRIDRVANSLSE
jgi:hypothetical protein